MNHEEYTQLVKASEAFSRLGEDLQKSILTAQGQEKDQFEQVFKTEKAGISAAQAEFARNNTEVVKEFETSSKKIKSDYSRSSEAHEKKDNEEYAKNLLNSLNN